MSKTREILKNRLRSAHSAVNTWREMYQQERRRANAAEDELLRIVGERIAGDGEFHCPHCGGLIFYESGKR